jgi:hypothetical protein
MRSTLALATLAWLLSASGATFAQDPPAVRDVLRANLEPSYLIVPVPLAGLDPVWYEANVVAHFVAHRASWPLALVLTPKIVIRLFREFSEPVKTPSYMPRLSLFMWLDEPATQRDAVRYASFTVAHHSNGQAGPVFLPGRRNNHEGGDFYTNHFELALHSFQPDQTALRWTRVAFEWHPVFFQQEDIVGRYGTLRALLDATVLEHPSIGGTLSASLGATLDAYTRNTTDSVLGQLDRFQLSVAYSVAFPGSEIAMFARYYHGRDYYNIWFDRTLEMLQLGISSHGAPLLSSED